MGCDVIRAVTTRQTRETLAVMNGARTATARFGGQITQFDLSKGAAMERNGANTLDEDQTLGLLLIGSDAIRAFMADPQGRKAWEQGVIAVACFPDVGDDAIADAKLTAYECDAGVIARWACRLMNDTRPGRRPVEFLIPGLLHVRETVHAKASIQPEQAGMSGLTRLPEIAI
ncbi:MAG: hypothetical protein KDA33_17115 [Phycisphaerales bacterium]|nr:hypothetical protein [Phycisphaerales bacterium]